MKRKLSAAAFAALILVGGTALTPPPSRAFDGITVGSGFLGQVGPVQPGWCLAGHSHRHHRCNHGLLRIR
jgi:hypothetical protein